MDVGKKKRKSRAVRECTAGWGRRGRPWADAPSQVDWATLREEKR